MKRFGIYAGVTILILLFLAARTVLAADLDIPLGDYEVLSQNAERTEFVLAFTGNYYWHVLATCLQPEILAPANGTICSYDGAVFTCPGAQSLGLLGILQQPDTPSPTFTPSLTITSTATQTATQIPSTTPTITGLPTATPSQTEQIRQGPSSTPVFPGAPASASLQATITAANRPFEAPEQDLFDRIWEWLKMVWGQVRGMLGVG